MTLPRQVVAGRTYLTSRRCTQRQHLLRPDARVEQIYLYCLAEACDRYKITLHGFIAMSNHQHLLVRDNLGNYPEFFAHFHKMTAKALNARWGRWENLWATEQPNAVYLVEAQDRFDKLIYLLCNPVADHLVERVAEWPGASSFGQHLRGTTRTIKRPRGFFREDGPMPQEVTLRIEPVDGFEHLAAKEWTDKVETAVRAQEEMAKAHRAKTGRRVLGRKAVIGTAPTSRPRTVEPRRKLRPHVACRNNERRVHELSALCGFRKAHRVARLRWIAGERRAVFPEGTYRFAALGARCQGAAEK